MRTGDLQQATLLLMLLDTNWDDKVSSLEWNAYYLSTFQTAAPHQAAEEYDIYDFDNENTFDKPKFCEGYNRHVQSLKDAAANASASSA